jgi:hypothetical protein
MMLPSYLRTPAYWTYIGVELPEPLPQAVVLLSALTTDNDEDDDSMATFIKGVERDGDDDDVEMFSYSNDGEWMAWTNGREAIVVFMSILRQMKKLPAWYGRHTESSRLQCWLQAVHNTVRQADDYFVYVAADKLDDFEYMLKIVSFCLRHACLKLDGVEQFETSVLAIRDSSILADWFHP